MKVDARQQPKPSTGEPTVQSSNPHQLSAAARLRFTVFMGILTSLLVGGTVFSMWLTMQPALPRFSVSSASISAFNLSSSHHLSGNWDLVFSVRNPSRCLTAKYRTVHVSIFYGSSTTILANTTLPPFSLRYSMETSISARLAAFSNYINDDTAVAALGLEKDGVRGSIEFGVTLFSRVRFWAGGLLPTRPYHIRVWCPNVPFGFSSPPPQGDGSLRECEVHM